jgi:hypothetical protein
MIAALPALFLFVIILVMMTLGSVLLVRFFMPGAGGPRRVFAAALCGPLALILPALVMVTIAEGTFEVEQVVAFAMSLLVLFGIIGWPVAHFATRRLDRLTQFDPQVFE